MQINAELYQFYQNVLATPIPPIAWLLLFFFINSMLSISIAGILVNSIRIEILKRKKIYFLLIACLGIFIPILGILLSIIITLLLKTYGKDFYPVSIKVYPQVEYSRKYAIKISAYGMGWATSRLQSPKFDKKERMEALLSVSRGFARDVNLIYSKLVTDDLEELRVCAFSMLENQLDYLNKQINLLIKKHQEISVPYKRAFIAKQLALLYWEMVYRNLSDKEFRAILLERSSYYASSVLDFSPDDTTMRILLARIDLTNGNLNESIDNFARASKLHAPASKITPYLAEMAFDNKNYVAVKQYFSSHPSLKYLLKINKIYHFWCKP